MTGRASAELICKAKVMRTSGTRRNPVEYEGYCGQVTRPDLINDGQYTNFVVPEGWHVELGFTPDKTIVRCPEHCRYWSASQAVDHTPHWEDAP